MLDFSSAGWKESLLHAIKIVGWYAISGAVASVGAYLSGINVSSTSVNTAVALMVANSVLAGLTKWIGTSPNKG